jgi:hypothetical protein
MKKTFQQDYLQAHDAAIRIAFADLRRGEYCLVAQSLSRLQRLPLRTRVYLSIRFRDYRRVHGISKDCRAAWNLNPFGAVQVGLVSDDRFYVLRWSPKSEAITQVYRLSEFDEVR